MEEWGIFTTEKELERMLRRVKLAGFEVFEVRPLSMIEKLTYVVDDARLYINNPHIIMFRTTEEKYNRFIRILRLKRMF